MPEVNHDGGLAPPVRVDPAVLRRSGQVLQLAGGALAEEVAAASSTLAAAGATAGWTGAAAAAGAAREWSERLRDYAGELDELGDRFATAAEAYLRCDAQAAGRTGQVAPQ